MRDPVRSHHTCAADLAYDRVGHKIVTYISFCSIGTRLPQFSENTFTALAFHALTSSSSSVMDSRDSAGIRYWVGTWFRHSHVHVETDILNDSHVRENPRLQSCPNSRKLAPMHSYVLLWTSTHFSGLTPWGYKHFLWNATRALLLW